MIRTFSLALLVLGVLGAKSAFAQAPPFSDAFTRPTVSPYLLLLRNDGSRQSAGTYQSIVRPMLEQQNQLLRQNPNNLQYQPFQGTGSNLQSRSPQTTGINPGAQGTGHTTTFMNFSHFFNLRGR